MSHPLNTALVIAMLGRQRRLRRGQLLRTAFAVAAATTAVASVAGWLRPAWTMLAASEPSRSREWRYVGQLHMTRPSVMPRAASAPQSAVALESETAATAPIDAVAESNSTVQSEAEADPVAEERKAAKESLLTAIASLERGFIATDAQRSEVSMKIDALAKLSPEPEPSAKLGGEWTLLYTDAPDIIGIPTGPLSNIKRIGQEIDADAGTITNVIEYEPSPLAAGLASVIGGNVAEDMIVQRVITDYKPASATSVDLNIKGLSFTPTRVLGVELPEMARIKAQGPLSLPFGSFDIKYLDDDLRIVRTRQGWYSINQRRI